MTQAHHEDEDLALALAAALTSLTEALRALSAHGVPLEHLRDLAHTLMTLEEALLTLALQRHPAHGPSPARPWPSA